MKRESMQRDDIPIRHRQALSCDDELISVGAMLNWRSGHTEYLNGLYRAAKPIEENPNYRAILGERVDRFMSRYSTLPIDEPMGCSEALSIFDRYLSGKTFVRFLIPPRQPLAFGKTRNNLREFAFLKEILQRFDLDDHVFNTGHIPPEVTGAEVTADISLYSAVRHNFIEYCRGKRGVSPSVLLQLISYTQAYLSWVYSFASVSDRLPSVVVLANDHSPAQVACSMAAKERNIPRVYLQHAEVSSAFPPLDFELSLLRNRVSRQVYSNMGPVPGEVFEVSRLPGSLRHPQLDLSKSSHKVGVYLTSQIRWSGVKAVIQELNANPQVHEVFIKPHPATSWSDIVRHCPGVEVREESAGVNHIAVAANSSVVIELLHVGIPVFQCFEMDSVPDDYYGFCRDGLAKEVPVSGMRDRFWSDFQFDEEWLEAFSKYDPSADGSASTDDALYRSLAILFRARSPGESVRARIDAGLGVSEDAARDASCADRRLHLLQQLLADCPVAMKGLVSDVSRIEQNEGFSDRELVRAIKDAYASRSKLAFEFFSQSKDVPVQSGFGRWLRLRDMELSGRAAVIGELEDLMSCAADPSLSENDRRSLEVDVFLLLIRKGLNKAACDFYKGAIHIQPESMHINKRVAILKWLRNNPAAAANVGIDIAKIYKNLSAFHMLKLRILTNDGSGFEGLDVSHSTVVEEFMAAAPEAVRESMEKYVLPAYRELGVIETCMNVRYSEGDQVRIWSEIEQALVRRQALSLIRLSDGEAYMFGGAEKVFSQEDMENRERHWWGVQLTRRERDALIPKLRKSVTNSTILGMPSIYRLLRDCNDASGCITESLTGRGLVQVLQDISTYLEPGVVVTEEKCNLPLFSSYSAIDRIAQLADRLVIVGSPTEREIRRAIALHRPLVYIQVPTHMRTARNDKYATGKKPLPYVYQDIEAELGAVVRPGDLVLVGAGIIGKVFVDVARASGAVSLDVGSSIDEWVSAGIHSLH